MSESLQGALAAIVGRCAPTVPPPYSEPDYYGRLPEDQMPRSDLKSGPKLLLAVLDAIDRHFGRKGYVDSTDGQLARACGVTVNTIGNWLKSLVGAGLIEKVGRTSRRIIRLVVRFVSGPASPKTGGSELPQKPGDTSPKTGGNSPKNGGELPQKPGDSSKEREKRIQARSSSSSPAPGDTPTTAKTQTGGTPPGPSAPPPPTPSLDHHEQKLTSRWEALPESGRSEIEAAVRAASPGMDRWPKLFRGLCLAELERRPEVPTDRELRAAVMFMDAADPAMRMAAARSLCDWGRADLVVDRIEFEAIKRTGRTLASPAGPKSPCRQPG